VFAGLAPFEPAKFVLQPVTLLPPAERRRAGSAVRLAIGVASEALTHAGRDPATMAMVFTSSGGDGDTVHEILCVLATAGREVSPTRFHNSVHNAPAGYWSVATGSCEPSTSLCAYDASFAAGLVDAAVQAMVDDRPVTLVAYDLPYPEPLHLVRPIVDLAGLALVLTPWPTDRSFTRITITPGGPGMEPTPMADARLERLRAGNPAARGLPLLAAIARHRPATICLEEASGTCADILVEPC
jgi:Beta-ketoacyl synthase, N-terminal domain